MLTVFKHPTIKKLRSGACVLLSAIAFLAFPATNIQAATITQVWDYTSDDPSAIDPVTHLLDSPTGFDHDFNKFDASVGVLTSVVVRVNGTLTSKFSITNNSASSFDYTATGELSLKLVDVDLKSISLLDHTLHSSLSGTLGAGATFNELLHTETPSAAYAYFGADLTPFITNSGPQQFLYSVDIADKSVTKAGGNIVYQYLAQAGYHVEIDYNYYNASAVPEPSSFALLGLGCAGLAVARFVRRRRRSETPA